jgi:hypothetical protein
MRVERRLNGPRSRCQSLCGDVFSAADDTVRGPPSRKRTEARLRSSGPLGLKCLDHWDASSSIAATQLQVDCRCCHSQPDHISTGYPRGTHDDFHPDEMVRRPEGRLTPREASVARATPPFAPRGNCWRQPHERLVSTWRKPEANRCSQAV